MGALIFLETDTNFLASDPCSGEAFDDMLVSLGLVGSFLQALFLRRIVGILRFVLLLEALEHELVNETVMECL